MSARMPAFFILCKNVAEPPRELLIHAFILSSKLPTVYFLLPTIF